MMSFGTVVTAASGQRMRRSSPPIQHRPVGKETSETAHILSEHYLIGIHKDTLVVYQTSVENFIPLPHSQQCVHALFADQATRTPETVAVVCGEQHLTYAELNRQANHLAHTLQQLGVGPEVRVGLCLERAPEFLIGILGILKGGGVYVPLDPQYPHARLDMLHRAARLKIILTTAELLKDWSPHDQDCCLLDIHSAVLTATASICLFIPPNTDPQQLAYILYTSGSTGTPKGVMIEHRSIVAFLHAFEQVAPVGQQRNGVAVCPFSFDVSVWEFFSILCFGGTLHILHPEIFADPKSFAGYLTNHHITNAYIPPVLLPVIAAALDKRSDQIVLNRLLVGVEPIKQSVLQQFRNLSAQLQIVNGYGPTETTICGTLFSFQVATDPQQRTPIGRAVPGYQVYLVDGNLQPVPIGVPGELSIAGVGLARGYLNQPALTAETFIPNPFSDVPGARLYKTGDLARYLPDGNIEFLGRVDHQVKIHGFRVELGEIEAVLVQHPTVREAVVVAREDVPGDKRLVGYVVMGKDQPPTVGDLRTFVQNRLPHFMLPVAFVILDMLPLTPNGKVDRRALPAPIVSIARAETNFAARTPIEEVLTGIWADVLGLEQIRVDDTFFEMGGNSLAALQIVARVRDAFQISLFAHHVFENPTVTQLASLVQKHQARRLSRNTQQLHWELSSLQTIPRNGPFPLSAPQERVWFLQQLNPGNNSYNFQAILRVSGHLDVSVLERSLNEIVRRHEIFRTTFPTIDGQPAQVIHPPWLVILPITDLESLTNDEHEAAIQRFLAQEFQNRFDLTRLR